MARAMRFAPPTADELRKNFSWVMDRIVAGDPILCPSGLGFDNETHSAIDAFARSSDQDPKLAAAAREALNGQITGVNEASTQAALEKMLDTPSE